MAELPYVMSINADHSIETIIKNEIGKKTVNLYIMRFIYIFMASSFVQKSDAWLTSLVYDLKFVGPLEFELVAPMPEQLKNHYNAFLCAS